MNALEQLGTLMLPARQLAAQAMPAAPTMDSVIAEMAQRLKSRDSVTISTDIQLDAVQRFWTTQSVESFRDSYLLSWSLCIPHRSGGPCVLEDKQRLDAVLSNVELWRGRAPAFQRCFQGLVKSYFTYDAASQGPAGVAATNCLTLRNFLSKHCRYIKDDRLCPEWVDVAIANQQIFGDDPCSLYAETLLRGEDRKIGKICESLGIDKSSWFLRDLVLKQIQTAVGMSDAEFSSHLPRLLELLAANEVLRDRGLILILDRYAQIAGSVLHLGLRDHAVKWWGNPWLPSNETRWGGVTGKAREMVANWLKLEFIEAFFTKLADDGLGDPRRMNFWKRYVKAIDHIEFALGTLARNSMDRDMVVLRNKMKGLICSLDATGANNAFIMRMGPFVAVEFSGLGNAFYCYDTRKSKPFDTSQRLRLYVDGRNSLKRKDQSILWLSHHDGMWGWEQQFEQELRSKLGISPAPAGPAVSSTPIQQPGPSKSPGVTTQQPTEADITAAAWPPAATQTPPLMATSNSPT